MSDTNVVQLSKTAVTFAVFTALLPKVKEIGSTNLRMSMINEMGKTYKRTSMPVFFNKAMKLAIEAKLIKAPLAQAKGTRVKLTDEQQTEVNAIINSTFAIATGREDVSLLEGMTWKVINKKTKAIVAYAANRKQAYTLRDGNAELSCKALKAA